MKGFRVWSNFWKKYAFDAELYGDGSLYAMFEDDDGVTHHENTDLVLEFDTGLKDKNGKEIYEGDIIHRGALPKVNVFRNSVIRFDEESVGFIATSTRNGARTLFNGHTCDEIEVIGNIHGNPELLGDTNVANKEEE